MMPKRKTQRQQRLDGELGLIIDGMVQAMWNANKEYIAMAESPITLAMNMALCRFQDYCVRYYGKKTQDA
jgi:hypothetical protein